MFRQSSPVKSGVIYFYSVNKVRVNTESIRADYWSEALTDLTRGPGWAVCLVRGGSTGTGAGCWWGRRSARPSVRPASSRCRWSPPAPPPRAPGRSPPGPSPTPPPGPTKTMKRRRVSKTSWWKSFHPRPGASRAPQGRDLPLQSSPPAGDISPLSCRLSASTAERERSQYLQVAELRIHHYSSSGCEIATDLVLRISW